MRRGGVLTDKPLESSMLLVPHESGRPAGSAADSASRSSTASGPSCRTSLKQITRYSTPRGGHDQRDAGALDATRRSDGCARASNCKRYREVVKKQGRLSITKNHPPRHSVRKGRGGSPLLCR